jgi:hypothetical protein
MRMLVCIAFLLFLSGCAASDSNSVEDVVDELIDALNSNDRAAAARLYADGKLEPITASSDSSVVYRLLTVPGGGDFEAENVETSVIGDQARAKFALIGTVNHEGVDAGTMTLQMQMELEKGDQGWKIIPGSEKYQVGM